MNMIKNKEIFKFFKNTKPRLVMLWIMYILLGIISFITIVGIPAGIVYVRSAKFVIWPIGAKCVSKKQAYAAAVANEIEKRQQ